MDSLQITKEGIVDVAIIGAGCAGLYCAWRLATDPNKKRTVNVFEKEGRVGGRLLSIDLSSYLIPDLPRTEKRKAELGGMRFTDKQMLINKVIARLEEDLALDRKNGPLNLKPYKFSTRLMYLLGKYLGGDRKDWERPLPYAALKNSYGVGEVATKVAKDVIREILRLMMKENLSDGGKWQHSVAALLAKDKLKKTTLAVSEWREWQEEATIDNEHIYELGFWELIERVTALRADSGTKARLKKDTPEFLREALGYQSLITLSNAAQSIPIFLADFDDPTYHTLAGGWMPYLGC